MTRLLAYSYDHLSCIAAYGSPEPHRHLALHFIFSVGGAFPGTAGGHCNVGNSKKVLDAMISWLREA